MKRDDLIFDIIEKEHQRQLKGIELIASENFVSDQVMEAMGSALPINMPKATRQALLRRLRGGRPERTDRYRPVEADFWRRMGQCTATLRRTGQCSRVPCRFESGR